MFPLTPDQHHWLDLATEDEGWCSFRSCTPSRSRARTTLPQEFNGTNFDPLGWPLTGEWAPREALFVKLLWPLVEGYVRTLTFSILAYTRMPSHATRHKRETLYKRFVNPLMGTWVSHKIIWSWYSGRWLVGCYIWLGRSPPRPLLAVPNATAHPSTASVYQSLYWCIMVCCSADFIVPTKRLNYNRWYEGIV